MTVPRAPELGIFRFGSYVLDEAERRLLKDGQPVKLTARMFDVLAVLVRSSGKLVTKDDLLRLAWPGLVVEEGNIHVQVSGLRSLFGRDAITTVARMGYRFELPLLGEGEEQGRAGEPVASNVPHPMSSIVGRQQELADIAALLRASRLVTLKGIGGIGKTRLAIHAGQSWSSDTRERVWFVSLASLSEGSMLASSAIRAIGGTSRNAKSARDELTHLAREKPTLLILDNCEHLIEEVASLCEHLLQNCPELRVLCTSRQSLGLTAEALFPVAPLSERDAVELFAARAKAAAPLVSMRDADMPMVTAIVQRLEGICLAIELAAARLRMLSLEEMDAMLRDRFHLLVGGSRIAQPRQQTLRSAIEWSFQLLSDEERALFRRLSVFEDSFTLDDAAGMLGTGQDDRWLLLEGMTSLADKSLIQCRPVNGEQRFELFDSLREFGRAKLGDAGELDEYRRVHARHYQRICVAAREIHETPQWAAEIKRLRVCYPNIRAALKWALEEGRDVQGGAEAAVGIFYFWIDDSMLDEGLGWLLGAGKHVEKLPALIQGRLLHAHGGLFQDLGRQAESERYLERSITILERDSLHQGDYAIALNELAVTRHYLAKYASADTLYQRALGIYRKLGLRQREGQSLLNLGVLYVVSDKLEEAKQTLGIALQVSHESGNQRAQSICLLWLAAIAYDRGLLEECLDLILKAQVLRSEFSNDLLAATIHHRLAKCAAVLGRLELARRSILEALQVVLMLENPRAWAEFFESSVAVVFSLGDANIAARLVGFAEAWRASNGIGRTLLWERELKAQCEKIRESLSQNSFDLEVDAGKRMSLSHSVQTIRTSVVGGPV